MPTGLPRIRPAKQDRSGTIARTFRGQSDGDDVEVRIEASQIVGIRCDHSYRSLTCGKSHRGVHDIGGIGHSAQLSHCSGSTIIENHHLAQRRAKQPGQPGLS